MNLKRIYSLIPLVSRPVLSPQDLVFAKRLGNLSSSCFCTFSRPQGGHDGNRVRIIATLQHLAIAEVAVQICFGQPSLLANSFSSRAASRSFFCSADIWLTYFPAGGLHTLRVKHRNRPWPVTPSYPSLALSASCNPNQSAWAFGSAVSDTAALAFGPAWAIGHADEYGRIGSPLPGDIPAVCAHMHIGSDAGVRPPARTCKEKASLTAPIIPEATLTILSPTMYQLEPHKAVAEVSKIGNL